MRKNYSISNLFIIISLLLTILLYFYPWLILFSNNRYFLYTWEYYYIPLQFIIGTFLHWSILHILFNSIFIYYFWNIVENIIWVNNYLKFFIFSIIFIWIWLLLSSSWNTIWISWFAMALLSYYTLELKSKNNPEYKWWITAIIINIVIWLDSNISMQWHILWAIAWIIFYFFINDIFRKEKLNKYA